MRDRQDIAQVKERERERERKKEDGDEEEEMEGEEEEIISRLIGVMGRPNFL